jgi:hypothetical protein
LVIYRWMMPSAKAERIPATCEQTFAFLKDQFWDSMRSDSRFQRLQTDAIGLPPFN